MKKFAVAYSLVIQFFVTEFILIFAGYFIGTKIDGEGGIWRGILGALGAIIAIILFIICAIRMTGDEIGKRKEHKDGRKDDASR